MAHAVACATVCAMGHTTRHAVANPTVRRGMYHGVWWCTVARPPADGRDVTP